MSNDNVSKLKNPHAANEVRDAKFPRVGFLSPLDRSVPSFEVFRQGLADLGYVEGHNIVIEPRFAEGQYERFPELAFELVRLKVDVIALLGAVTARAVKKVTTSVPIVGLQPHSGSAAQADVPGASRHAAHTRPTHWKRHAIAAPGN